MLVDKFRPQGKKISPTLTTDKKKIFCVFVNNIPTRIYSRYLKRVFQQFGKLVDVYIVKKRTKYGGIFGFVRFERSIDAQRTVSRLNVAWLLNQRLRVNMA